MENASRYLEPKVLEFFKSQIKCFKTKKRGRRYNNKYDYEDMTIKKNHLQ